MMTDQTYIYALICLSLSSIFLVISADQACDKSRCKGPIKYYEDVQCIPIYSAEDSCCPVRYNCDHLKGRAEDKCYYKGHVYAIGERLRAEDAKPCDIGCFCSKGWNGPAHFSCAIVDCFNRPGPGCYLKKSPNRCCAGPQVCPRDQPDIPRCEVDGITYYDGQEFTAKSDPTLSCICAEGYKGENVAPYCQPIQVKPYTCDVELRHSTEIYKNCAPAFYSTQNPATDCNIFSRCQNNDDRVEVANATTTEVTPTAEPGATCTFGNLTMNVGDKLNSGTYYTSVCLDCVCEVPPLPTCKRLPDNECDITVHKNFDNFSK